MPNNNLGSDQAIPSIPGFNPGGGATVIRQIDGHFLGANGIDGANIHDPSAPHADFDAVPSLDVDDSD